MANKKDNSKFVKVAIVFAIIAVVAWKLGYLAKAKNFVTGLFNKK